MGIARIGGEGLMRPFSVILAALALSGPAPAFAADELDGTWIWSVEGRNVFVLKLEDGPEGLHGTLQRPAGITISPYDGGWALTGAVLPVVTYTVTETREDSGGHILNYEGPAGSGEYLLLPDGPDRALFAPDSSPGAPRLALHRPRAADAVATDWDEGRSYLSDRAPVPSNAEMAAIYAADQADRHAGMDTDWTVVAPRDRARRQRVRELLDQGLLASGQDYQYAAFVFQHGDEPEDYLLAHALAMAAQAKGKHDAAWIAAASLDRYLSSTGENQIFGTQFERAADGTTVQKPGDTVLVTDAVRRAVGVPPLTEQTPPP